MERQLGVGLVLGLFISGLAGLVIADSQQLAVGLLIVGVILWFLFVNPWSPVRKRWWSVSSKLGVTLADNRDVEVGIGENSFTVRVGFNAVSSTRVEKISLKVGRVKVWSSDWIPIEIEGLEGPYVNFPRPRQISEGCYNARLCAYTPDGISNSERFSISVLDG